VFSCRVRECISLGRRKAVFGVKQQPDCDNEEEKKEKPKLPTEIDISEHFSMLYDHSKCTNKHKACSRCKQIEKRRQELKPVKQKAQVQSLRFSNDSNIDLVDQKVKAQKSDYIVLNNTLYFKYS